MANKRIVIALLVNFASAICCAQTTILELEPGTSTRQDVERALGRPSHTINATRVQYPPPEGIEGIEVHYGTAGVVERIEVSLVSLITRRALIAKYELPTEPGTRKKRPDGTLVEYFGGTAFLAFTYASSDVASGVTSIGHYSPQSFAAASGLAGTPQQSGQETAPTLSGPNRKACSYMLSEGIYNKWFERQEFLGCPKMNEREANRSPHGTEGRYARFGPGAAIYWHRTGPHAGKAYEIYGCIDHEYTRLGGSQSWLGFPTSNLYIIRKFVERVDFEGGYIGWDGPGVDCKAHKSR